MHDELRHMLLVVEHGTFTAAARHAHLTQPALSAAIARLEERVGARLFDRGRHGAVLTAAGEVLMPRARAAIAAFDDGVRAVAELEGLERGEVRLGGGATACTYLLPRAMAAFRRAHPGIVLRLREGFSQALHDELEAGALDLAIVTGEGSEPWRDDPLILVASPKLARRGAGAVTFAAGSPTRALLEHHFPELEIVMELGSIAAVKGNVRAGVGIALISRHAVKRDLADGSMVEVKSRKTPVVRQLSLLHRGTHRLPPAAAAMRKMLLRRAYRSSG